MLGDARNTSGLTAESGRLEPRTGVATVAVAIVLDRDLSNPLTLATGEGVRFTTAALGELLGVAVDEMLIRDSTNTPALLAAATTPPLAPVFSWSASSQ